MRGDRGRRQPALPGRVGRYNVLMPIAAGGMAAVYLARSRGAGGFERDVALKLAHAHLAADSAFAEGLLDEAKLAVRIKHPNVVQVIDVGEDPAGLFLVMDYVEGDSLDGLFKRAREEGGKLPAPIAVRILLDMLAGLHAAHELRDERGTPLGLVHRDVSPHNVLVGVDGVSRLADFGIAKAISRTSHTVSGSVKGKVSYMSPEQARARQLDRRADVWSAGVLAWEALAGRKMHPSDDASTLLAIVTEPAPLLRTVAPEVSAEMEEAIASALTIDAEKRCPSARALAQAIERAARSSCGVADPAEVAELVESLVGQKLADRRARVAEVVALRERMESITSAERVLAGSSVAPASPTSSASSAAGAVAVPIMSATEVAAPTETGTVSVKSPESLPPPALRKWRLRGALISLAGVVLGAVAAFTWGGSSSAPQSAAPVETAGVAASVASSGGSIPTVAPVSSASAPPAVRTVEVRSNVPMTEIRIAGKVTKLDPAKDKVSVEVSASEGEALTVDARAKGGRTVAGSLSPGKDRIDLEFPPIKAQTGPSRSPTTEKGPKLMKFE